MDSRHAPVFSACKVPVWHTQIRILVPRHLSGNDPGKLHFVFPITSLRQKMHLHSIFSWQPSPKHCRSIALQILLPWMFNCDILNRVPITRNHRVTYWLEHDLFYQIRMRHLFQWAYLNIHQWTHEQVILHLRNNVIRQKTGLLGKPIDTEPSST